MGFVYGFQFPNCKWYVGQTKKSPKKRWHLHRVKRNHSWYVANAIKKYGWENIKKVVLAVVPDELLDEEEKKFIVQKNSLKPNGYNLTPGGDFNPMDDDDVCAKHRESVQKEDHRERQKTFSLSWHQDAQKHDAWKDLNAEAARNPEALRKKSIASAENWKNPEVRELRLQNMAKAFSDPETRKRQVDASIKGNKTEQSRKNKSEGHAKARARRLAALPPDVREKEELRLQKNREKTNRYLQRKREREFET